MKLTFRKKEVHLFTAPLTVGTKLSFRATDKDFSNYTLDTKHKKVISVFPSIDTGTCDKQTRKIAELSKEYKKYSFISISLDLPPALSRWCMSNEKNITTLSDYKTREFGEKYGFLLKDLYLLTRGLIITDEDNVVQYVQYVPEVSDSPDFVDLEKHLNK